MPGWTNEHLEELIKSGTGHIDKERLSELYNWFVSLDDEQSVEVTRMALTNLAYRHSGFYENGELSSLEGMYFSMNRVLKLLKESVKESSGY